MPKLNYKRIPVITTTQLKKAFERNGFKTDEDNHKHIILINELGQKLLLRKGNKEYTKFVLLDIIKQFAKHKGITDEEALVLLFGKK